MILDPFIIMSFIVLATWVLSPFMPFSSPQPLSTVCLSPGPSLWWPNKRKRREIYGSFLNLLFSNNFFTFRARHLEVRTNLEPIAFYQSGFTENVFTNHKLKELLKTQKHLVIWQLWLNCWFFGKKCRIDDFEFSVATNYFDYFGGNLSYMIIAIAIFVQNKYEDKVGPELNGIISEVLAEFLAYDHYCLLFRMPSTTYTWSQVSLD